MSNPVGAGFNSAPLHQITLPMERDDALHMPDLADDVMGVPSASGNPMVGAASQGSSHSGSPQLSALAGPTKIDSSSDDEDHLVQSLTRNLGRCSVDPEALKRRQSPMLEEMRTKSAPFDFSSSMISLSPQGDGEGAVPFSFGLPSLSLAASASFSLPSAAASLPSFGAFSAAQRSASPQAAPMASAPSFAQIPGPSLFSSLTGGLRFADVHRPSTPVKPPHQQFQFQIRRSSQSQPDLSSSVFPRTTAAFGALSQLGMGVESQDMAQQRAVTPLTNRVAVSPPALPLPKPLPLSPLRKASGLTKPSTRNTQRHIFNSPKLSFSNPPAASMSVPAVSASGSDSSPPLRALTAGKTAFSPVKSSPGIQKSPSDRPMSISQKAIKVLNLDGPPSLGPSYKDEDDRSVLSLFKRATPQQIATSPRPRTSSSQERSSHSPDAGLEEALTISLGEQPAFSFSPAADGRLSALSISASNGAGLGAGAVQPQLFFLSGMPGVGSLSDVFALRSSHPLRERPKAEAPPAPPPLIREQGGYVDSRIRRIRTQEKSADPRFRNSTPPHRETHKSEMPMSLLSSLSLNPDRTLSGPAAPAAGPEKRGTKRKATEDVDAVPSVGIEAPPIPRFRPASASILPPSLSLDAPGSVGPSSRDDEPDAAKPQEKRARFVPSSSPSVSESPKVDADAEPFIFRREEGSGTAVSPHATASASVSAAPIARPSRKRSERPDGSGSVSEAQGAQPLAKRGRVLSESIAQAAAEGSKE